MVSMPPIIAASIVLALALVVAVVLAMVFGRKK
jgi:hypothetical protein